MDVLVSVLTTAYNHANFIEKALDGFLMQKTDFRFEVIVHDDASTDGTADIIRAYAQKYPDIIIPVLQEENQYSRGKSPYQFMLPLVRGKYIAQCEGDDYWCDEYKLQKQIDALEAHPEVDICATRAQLLRGDRIIAYKAPRDHDAVIPTGEVIMGGGGYVATASLVYRGDLFRNPPAFFRMLSLDYTVQITGSLRGGMLYLNDLTSVYRIISSDDAWSTKMKRNPDKVVKKNAKVREMLGVLNEETHGKYDSEIEKTICALDYDTLEHQQKYREMLFSPKYREIVRALPRKKKLRLAVLSAVPGLKRLKNKIEFHR